MLEAAKSNVDDELDFAVHAFGYYYPHLIKPTSRETKASLKKLGCSFKELKGLSTPVYQCNHPLADGYGQSYRKTTSQLVVHDPVASSLTNDLDCKMVAEKTLNNAAAYTEAAIVDLGNKSVVIE